MMTTKDINWRYYGGCLAVGLALSTAYVVGDLYGPKRGGGLYDGFTDAQMEHAAFLCESEIGIDTKREIHLCMGDELMAGRLLDAHVAEYPGTVHKGCLSLKALIGNRVALDCAMGRTGKTRKASAEPDASTAI